MGVRVWVWVWAWVGVGVGVGVGQRRVTLLVDVDLPQVDHVGDRGGRVALDVVGVEVKEREGTQLADLARDRARDLIVVERQRRA